MNTILTQDYQKWWRDAGQFLEPADAMSNDPRGLELLKSWGQSLWEMKLPLEEAAIEEAAESKEASEKAEEALDDLKKNIADIIDLRDETTADLTLNKILDLVT